MSMSCPRGTNFRVPDFSIEHQAWQQRIRKERLASINYYSTQQDLSEYQTLVDYLSQRLPRNTINNKSLNMAHLQEPSLQNTIASFFKQDGDKTQKHQTISEYNSRPPSASSKRPKSIFASSKKKKRERFNEELGKAVDDAKSTMRSRQGTRRSRPSICYSMNQKQGKREGEMVSIALSECQSRVTRGSKNQNYEIEKKADLINAIKQMDEGQIKNSYQQIKSIITESSRAPTEQQSQINKGDFRSITSQDFDQESLRAPQSTISQVPTQKSSSTMFQSQLYIKELEGKLEKQSTEKEKLEKELEQMKESQRSMQEMLNQLLFDQEFKEKSGKKTKQK